MLARPNLLILMADQLTAGVLPAYGGKVAKTPHRILAARCRKDRRPHGRWRAERRICPSYRRTIRALAGLA
jgi:hypothetical protein